MKEDIRIQGQLRVYLQWPLFMAVILMAANVVIGLVDLKAGIVMTGFTLVYAVFCAWLYLYKRKRLLGGLLDFSAEYARLQQNMLADMEFPYASSACEMVAEILQYVGDGIKMKSVEADAMYAGIVIDTNNFMNQAGVRTFEAAAFLRRNGADVVRVRKLFRDRVEDYRARAEAVRRAEIFEKEFAISECPSEGLESPTVIGAQAANELLNIIGIKASFVMTQVKDTIFFSARSIDEVNVQVMMEKLGGGGHRTIAGAQLKDTTLEQARERLKEMLLQMKEKGEI